MKLTIKIERLLDGRFKGFFVETPAMFYTGASEQDLVDRLSRLAHALESPNVWVDRILPNGEVVLVLRREDALKKVRGWCSPSDLPTRPVTPTTGRFGLEKF